MVSLRKGTHCHAAAVALLLSCFHKNITRSLQLGQAFQTYLQRMEDREPANRLIKEVVVAAVHTARRGLIGVLLDNHET